MFPESRPHDYLKKTIPEFTVIPASTNVNAFSLPKYKGYYYKSMSVTSGNSSKECDEACKYNRMIYAAGHRNH